MISAIVYIKCYTIIFYLFQITGSDMFLYATIRNFETMCLNDAKKFENLTDTDTNIPNGGTKSIFSVIAESTCPNNCSGKGSCTEGMWYIFFASYFAVRHLNIHKIIYNTYKN